ncbi:MAG: dihydroorotate dehydrogenase [Candidatus Omnitrophica bacterium]|nr:dihydroorotate dehydrogenase [Candidatus Omnitrophota bacterium]
MVELTTKIGDLVFKNPVTVASGTFGVKDEFAPYFDYALMGGVITKTVTTKPREGNAMPRICETSAGMLNAIGLQNKGVEAFLKDVIPYFRSIDTHLIVNVAGKSAEEFAEAARPFSGEATVKALELNLSCPNVSGGLDFSKNALEAKKVIRAVRAVTTKLLFAKLTPEAENVVSIAEAVMEAGADGVSLINTLVGMAVNLREKRPSLANITGGLSGPAIKPIAMRHVFEVKRKLRVPVIAMGGITTAKDALEFLLVGADLISVGTANFINPMAAPEIVQGIREYLEKEGVKSVGDFRGTLKL